MKMRTVLSSAESRLTSGTPYWPVRTDPPTYPPLAEDAWCDLAIVGGGITGALIAHRAVGAGLSSLLVDKGRFGAGSTCASTALIGYEFDVMLSDLIEQAGENDAVRAYQLCYEATARLKDLVEELEDPCDYDTKLCVRITDKKDDAASFEKEAKVREKHGFKMQLCDRAELLKRFGLYAFLGLVSENAAQIDPFKLASRLIKTAAQRGLRAYEKTRVSSYEPAKEGISLKTAGGQTIRAKQLVFATGYQTVKYLPKKATELTTDFCFISHPVENMAKLSKCHVVENEEDYFYLSTFGDRVMVGMQGPTFYLPRERAKLLDKRTKEVMDRVAVHIPDIELTVDHHWAGTFANSPDSLPYLGEAKRLLGAYCALGYGGNGIASSAMLAPILLDIVQGKNNLDARIFRFER